MSVGKDAVAGIPETEWNAFVLGITYRQWLIGKALAGILANPEFATTSVGDTTKAIIDQVDSVLERLDSEP